MSNDPSKMSCPPANSDPFGPEFEALQVHPASVPAITSRKSEPNATTCAPTIPVTKLPAEVEGNCASANGFAGRTRPRVFLCLFFMCVTAQGKRCAIAEQFAYVPVVGSQESIFKQGARL